MHLPKASLINTDSVDHLSRLVLAFVIACLFGQFANADHFDCYILAGQSNMDGRGSNSGLPDDIQHGLNDAIIFYSNPPLATEDWQPLQLGFSRPPGYKGQLPSPKFGPEIGFVKELKRHHPKRKIAIIKASEGGTNLRSDWKAGEPEKPESQGRCYRNLLTTIRDSTEKLTARGHTWTLRGMLWHQGESDSKANPEVHQERLTHLIARIREDCQAPDLPVVLGQVVDNGKRDKVRSAIKATAEAVRLTQVVESDELTTWDEGTHFDATSQLELGRRFASMMASMQAPDRSEETTVVCFGDSITKRGYPKILGELVNAKTINSGVGGHTSRQGMHRFENDVLSHQPTVVVILFGTNDMRADSKKHVSVKEFSQHLSTMVQGCRKNGADVILCSVPPINDEPYFTRHDRKPFEEVGGLQALVKAYGEAAQKTAVKCDATFLDLHRLLQNDSEWMSSDGVHPSDAGNLIIAQHVSEVVMKLLSDRDR